MRLGLIGALIVAFAGPAVAQAPLTSFEAELPDGVADVAGWEIVSGEFETRTARGAYRFYVNPARRGLYQLMRYRVELLDAAGATPRRLAERLAFVTRPGAREPIACWEKQAQGLTPSWRRIDSGSDEYRFEMAVLLNVIAVHRTARGLEPSP